MNESQTRCTTPPKKRGCFFYGCLTLLILTVVLGVAAFLAARYALSKVNALVEQYTDTRPATLPKVEMDPADYEKLAQRLEEFKAGLEGQQEVAALALTAQDLNGLIANHPDLKALKDRLYVTIDGDQVKGQISMPLAEWAGVPGLSGMQGRYLNGAAAFKVSLDAGVLDLHILSLEVKGTPLPEPVLAALRGENLAKDLTRDPKTAEALQKLERLEVSEGTVTLKARSSGVQAESPP
jgi:hypothetical protein